MPRPINFGNPKDRPEFKILVLSSRTEISETHKEKLRRLLGDDRLRWDYLVNIAGHHGVQALLYRHLLDLEVELPPDSLAPLRTAVRARSAHSLVLTQELKRLVELFTERGIEALAVKGVALAQRVYGSVALRPFVDIDLLIRRSSYELVEAILHADGYQYREMGPFQKRSYLYVNGQYTFWRTAQSGRPGPSVLDVHTAVMPPGYSYSASFDELWVRAEELGMGGALRTPSPEDLLLVLCYHGFKNRWDRLKYVGDVAELIRARAIDWDAVVARSKAMQSLRVLGLGLNLASEVLGATLPEGRVLGIAHESRVVRLGSELAERLPLQAHLRVEPFIDRVRLNVFGQDSLKGSLRYGGYTVLRRAAEVFLPEGA